LNAENFIKTNKIRIPDIAYDYLSELYEAAEGPDYDLLAAYNSASELGQPPPKCMELRCPEVEVHKAIASGVDLEDFKHDVLPTFPVLEVSGESDHETTALFRIAKADQERNARLERARKLKEQHMKIFSDEEFIKLVEQYEDDGEPPEKRGRFG
jgi:hypothetical protein